MNRLLTLTLAVVLAASTHAAPCAWLQNSVASKGTNVATMLLQFSGRGITAPADQAAILASGFDVQTIFNVAIQYPAFDVLSGMSRNGYLTASNQAVVGQAFLNAVNPPAEKFNLWLYGLPVSQRGAYADLALRLAATQPRNAACPVEGLLFVKYQVLRGVGQIPCAAMTDQELVTYLLAPEPMGVLSATRCRTLLLDRAVGLARQQARGVPASTNGVSAVSALVAPVVTALNAPLCNGLEPALQSLGSGVTNVDRAAVAALVSVWTNGAVTVEQQGKVSVVMGVDAFNQWGGVFTAGN